MKDLRGRCIQLQVIWGEGKNIFRIAVVILQRNFDFDMIPPAFHVDRRVVEDLLAAIPQKYQIEVSVSGVMKSTTIDDAFRSAGAS